MHGPAPTQRPAPPVAAGRTPLRFEPAGDPPDVVLVSNNAYRLESLRVFGTRARLDAGRLGVVTAAVRRSWDVPLLMAAEITGRVRGFRGCRSRRTDPGRSSTSPASCPPCCGSCRAAPGLTRAGRCAPARGSVG